MDIVKDDINRFLQTKEAKVMEIPGESPASLKVVTWRFLKSYKERSGIDPNIRISLIDNGIRLTKNKIPKTFFLLEDGSKVYCEEYREPSKDVQKFCQQCRDKVNGTLPSWEAEDFEIPTEEKIKEWNMSKADERLCLKTLQEIKKEQE